MPAPLRDPVEQTLTGKVTRLWGGDNFEFLSGKETHYFLLRGVDAPDAGQPLFNRSKNMIRSLTRGKQVTVQVIARDEVMREIVHITVPVGKTKGEFDSDEFDLGAELIKRGWARYSGTPFEGAERFVEAEALAKEGKLGIWAEPKEPSEEEANVEK